MYKDRELPEALHFLKRVTVPTKNRYRSAWWLKTDFASNVWECNFGREPFTISFDVILDDGESLCHPKHRTLLDSFKVWLCVQAHPDTNGGKVIGKEATFSAVSRVFRLIDFFILNARHYDLSRNGIGALTASDLRSIVATIASSNRTSTSIYQLEEAIRNLWQEAENDHNSHVIDRTLYNVPAITAIDYPQCDWSLELNPGDLIRFRAYLWSGGLYQGSMGGGGNLDYRYKPDRGALIQLIYPNTLWAKRSVFEMPEELCFEPVERYQNEYVSAPVRTGTGVVQTSQQLGYWRSSLMTLEYLKSSALPFATESLSGISMTGWYDSLKLRGAGRFATLPQIVVFGLLRQSIEFALDHGDELINAYVQMARRAKIENLTIVGLVNKYGIAEFLSPSLKKMGVTCWHLAQTVACSEANPARPDIPRATTAEYFERFRSNQGLYELLVVLVGSVQICVGTLMSRRQAELMDLDAGSCLDKTRTYLIFENRKTGILGVRDTEARPIPPIAARLIGMLERLQTELIKDGILDEYTSLFATPHRSNLTLCLTHASFNYAFDRACDYFETPLDEESRRYYVRQHQLRRFFATLFFWGGAFGGVDTLRWFLGHTDVEHLYNYITESTPGAVLRWTKAEYVTEEVEQGALQDSLGPLIKEHFGTEKVSVLDKEELCDYIDTLLFDGVVTVEPAFFLGPNGKSYQIVVTVKEENEH